MPDEITTGTQIAATTLLAIDGAEVALPDPQGRLTHLQFRRFASCPICHLHMRQLQLRAEEIERAGVREVIVYHSDEAEMRSMLDGLRFAAFVADPRRMLYERFGVRRSPRAVLHPKAWWAGAKGLLANARRAWRMAPIGENPLGLPADFLIDRAGVVIACKRGAHADDQWTVDDLLALAATRPRTAAGWPIKSGSPVAT